MIAGENLYGGSYRLFTGIYEKLGIKFHFVDIENASNVEQFINSNTKMIWVETPTNPTMQIADIHMLSSIAKKYNVLMAVGKFRADG